MMRLLAISASLATTSLALLELPISKRDGLHESATIPFARGSHVDKRELSTNVFDLYSWSYGGQYFTNISVGTPPQVLTVGVATGLSDTVVNGFCNIASSSSFSCRGGNFNPSESSTYQELDSIPMFEGVHGDGSTSSGPFATDVLGIGDIQVSSSQFAIANNISSTAGYATGFLGLGYSVQEYGNSSYQYPNVPDVLYQSGIINSRLYSVYYGSGDEIASGSVLFGAVDNSKYTGSLVTVNLLPSYADGDSVTDFVVAVTGASANTAATGGKETSLWSGGPANISSYSSNATSFPVYIDSGTTSWYVPSGYFTGYIKPAFPYVDENNTCGCSHASSDDSLTVTIADAITVTVPASNLIMPIIDEATRQPVLYNGSSTETKCFFAIYPSNSSTSFGMGDPLLRSMYAVFDLDNGQISIAQAAYNVTGDPQIEEVEAGSDGLAKAANNVVTTSANPYSIPTALANSVRYTTSSAETALATATGLAAIPVSAQISSSAISSDVPMPNQTTAGTPGHTGTGSSDSSSSSSHAGAIAGGVVGGVAGLALIAGAAYFFLRRRKANARKAPQMREVQSEWAGSPPQGGNVGSPPQNSSMFSKSPQLGRV